MPWDRFLPNPIYGVQCDENALSIAWRKNRKIHYQSVSYEDFAALKRGHVHGVLSTGDFKTAFVENFPLSRKAFMELLRFHPGEYFHDGSIHKYVAIYREKYRSILYGMGDHRARKIRRLLQPHQLVSLEPPIHAICRALRFALKRRKANVLVVDSACGVVRVEVSKQCYFEEIISTCKNINLASLYDLYPVDYVCGDYFETHETNYPILSLPIDPPTQTKWCVVGAILKSKPTPVNLIPYRVRQFSWQAIFAGGFFFMTLLASIIQYYQQAKTIRPLPLKTISCVLKQAQDKIWQEIAMDQNIRLIFSSQNPLLNQSIVQSLCDYCHLSTCHFSNNRGVVQ